MWDNRQPTRRLVGYNHLISNEPERDNRLAIAKREWRHDSDKTQTNKLEWWMILKISLRAKAGVPKTLVKQKFHLHSLYFPQNKLTSTESRGEFSDLHSIFGLRALRYCYPDNAKISEDDPIISEGVQKFPKTFLKNDAIVSTFPLQIVHLRVAFLRYTTFSFLGSSTRAICPDVWAVTRLTHKRTRGVTVEGVEQLDLLKGNKGENEKF